jgi:hypothetical protein
LLERPRIPRASQFCISILLLLPLFPAGMPAAAAASLFKREERERLLLLLLLLSSRERESFSHSIGRSFPRQMLLFHIGKN